MSNIDWRIKYYGVQLLSLGMSTTVILAGVLGMWLLESNLALWASVPVAAALGGAGWWTARHFSPHSAKHLSPREWEELRGAMEDVPVLSVFHIFTVDRSRLERFRHIPLLKRYLWEVMAEDEVDERRVVRAAFLLHAFKENLQEYEEGLPLVEDEIVCAWMRDLIRERNGLKERANLRALLPEIPRLIKQLATPTPEDDSEDEAMEAAWRLVLFGPLAHQQLRSGLEHRDPRVRESCLALLEIIRDWPERHKDLTTRIQRDVHPSVQMAAMELIATEGRKALSILQEQMSDPFLRGRAEELINNIEAN